MQNHLNSALSLGELFREEKINYFRKWRAENKDKVKKHNENYWKRKAEQKLKNKINSEEA